MNININRNINSKQLIQNAPASSSFDINSFKKIIVDDLNKVALDIKNKTNGTYIYSELASYIDSSLIENIDDIVQGSFYYGYDLLSNFRSFDPIKKEYDYSKLYAIINTNIPPNDQLQGVATAGALVSKWMVDYERIIKENIIDIFNQIRSDIQIIKSQTDTKLKKTFETQLSKILMDDYGIKYSSIKSPSLQNDLNKLFNDDILKKYKLYVGNKYPGQDPFYSKDNFSMSAEISNFFLNSKSQETIKDEINKIINNIVVNLPSNSAITTRDLAQWFYDEETKSLKLDIDTFSSRFSPSFKNYFGPLLNARKIQWDDIIFESLEDDLSNPNFNGTNISYDIHLNLGFVLSGPSNVSAQANFPIDVIKYEYAIDKIWKETNKKVKSISTLLNHIPLNFNKLPLNDKKTYILKSHLNWKDTYTGQGRYNDFNDIFTYLDSEVSSNPNLEYDILIKELKNNVGNISIKLYDKSIASSFDDGSKSKLNDTFFDRSKTYDSNDPTINVNKKIKNILFKDPFLLDIFTVTKFSTELEEIDNFIDDKFRDYNQVIYKNEEDFLDSLGDFLPADKKMLESIYDRKDSENITPFAAFQKELQNINSRGNKQYASSAEILEIKGTTGIGKIQFTVFEIDSSGSPIKNGQKITKDVNFKINIPINTDNIRKEISELENTWLDDTPSEEYDFKSMTTGSQLSLSDMSNIFQGKFDKILVDHRLNVGVNKDIELGKLTKKIQDEGITADKIINWNEMLFNDSIISKDQIKIFKTIFDTLSNPTWATVFNSSTKKQIKSQVLPLIKTSLILNSDDEKQFSTFFGISYDFFKEKYSQNYSRDSEIRLADIKYKNSGHNYKYELMSLHLLSDEERRMEYKFIELSLKNIFKTKFETFLEDNGVGNSLKEKIVNIADDKIKMTLSKIYEILKINSLTLNDMPDWVMEDVNNEVEQFIKDIEQLKKKYEITGLSDASIIKNASKGFKYALIGIGSLLGITSLIAFFMPFKTMIASRRLTKKTGKKVKQSKPVIIITAIASLIMMSSSILTMLYVFISQGGV